MLVRSYYPTGNDKWTFGQVTSVLLLAIPLVTIFEYFYPGTVVTLLSLASFQKGISPLTQG